MEPRPFGVALGRGRIAVHGAEIALPVHQRQAQRKILRHAHQRVIDREIAVRVIFAHHLADHAGAFHIFLVPVEAHVAHGVEDAPVHGLQPVARIGERAADDDAH